MDYTDCEYIIILNTSIVTYDCWRLSVLRSSTPSMPIFGNRHRQKACLHAWVLVTFKLGNHMTVKCK